MDFKGTISALSASSSLTLLSSIPEDGKAKRSPYPKNNLCFLSLPRKTSAVSALLTCRLFKFYQGVF
jgi:hypothetical protein